MHFRTSHLSPKLNPAAPMALTSLPAVYYIAYDNEESLAFIPTNVTHLTIKHDENCDITIFNITLFYLRKLVLDISMSVVKVIIMDCPHLNSFSTYDLWKLTSKVLLTSYFSTNTISECSADQLLLGVRRTCGPSGDEEGFEIYEGKDTNGNALIAQTSCTAKVRYLCINPVEHTLVMRDSGLNGWSTGSSLILKSGNLSLEFVMESRYLQTNSFFNFGMAYTEVPTTMAPTDGTQEQFQIMLIRTCSNSSDSEGFTINEGATRDHAIYSQTTCAAGVVKLNITRGLYTIVMTNSNEQVWAENSMVRIFYGSLLGSYMKVVVGAEESAVFALPEVIEAGAAWKYSSEAMVGTSWTTENVDWNLISEYPAISSITRYFRQSYTLSGTGFRSVIIQVKTNGGFVFYVNGVEASRFNLPSGEITATTQATELKESNVYRILRLSLDAYSAVNGVYEFAVEMHAAEGQIGQAEHFECSVEFTIYEQSLVGSGQATSNLPGMLGYWIQNLFDNSISTKYRVAVTSSDFPVEVTYTSPEGDANTMNKYVLINGDSISAACNTWKIFGRKNEDSDEWVMLDSQDSVEWQTATQSLTFTLSNVNA